MSFYITTPIYYVNDVPHVGHAYTTIAADALARFHRSRGESTYFLTGTDEHGQKIEEAAGKRAMTPLDLADGVVERFKETWERLDIGNDDFIRTTEERHKRVVKEIWKRMEAAGDIYLGAYEGYYCVSCESFYPEKDLDDGNRCPTHHTEASWLKEPSYFFKMSEFGEKLLAHIDANPNFIRPQNYKNEVVSFVKSGLRDLSVSRTTFDWGIRVPTGDGEPSDHIMYVWVDALSNYVSALGDLDSDKNKKYWPASCHLIGKDILRFHAVYWPCILMSAGLPLPESIVTHGWWTVRGEKISKSLPATRVDPNELADDIGADALRYFLLREIPLGLDGDFSYEQLISRYNSELANDLGNLVGRATAMNSKYFDGALPKFGSDLALADPDSIALLESVVLASTTAAKEFENYAPSRALEAIWALVREGNRYVDACQPWTLAKDESKRAELHHVIRSVFEALAMTARMMWPVMPAKALELIGRLGFPGERGEALVSTWPEPKDFGNVLDGAGVIEKGGLFQRIEEDRAAELLNKWIPDDAKIESKPPEPTNAKQGKAKPTKQGKAKPAKQESSTISFQDFQRLELRVAKITAAEPVPKTKKLLMVSLDVGELGARQVVAGIAEAYESEKLIGKSVIFVANLEPATIRGVRSEGMILAAGDKSIDGLSALDRDVAPGTIVR